MKGLLAIVTLALYSTQSSASVIDRTDVQARAPAACGNIPRKWNSGSRRTQVAPSLREMLPACSDPRRDQPLLFTGSITGSIHHRLERDLYVSGGRLGGPWHLLVAYTSQICDSVPFYVVDNPTRSDHIYTTNITERDTLVDSQGYVDEGIAMYVLPCTG